MSANCWPPDNEMRRRLERLGDCFRQGWSEQHPTYALRVRGVDGAEVPWDKMKRCVPTMAVQLRCREALYTHRLRPSIDGWDYAILGDQHYVLERYTDWFFNPASKVLWLLRECGHPDLGPFDNWHQGREWLRLVFEASKTRSTGVVEDCLPAKNGEGVITLNHAEPWATRIVGQPGPDPYEKLGVQSDQPYIDPWADMVAFDHEAMEFLAQDLSLACADAIDWLLREADIMGGATPETPDGMPADLPNALRLVLPVLKEAGAVAGSDVWIPKAKIAVETSYRPDSLNRPLAQATRDGWLTSKGGPTGGYQLTQQGEYTLKKYV